MVDLNNTLYPPIMPTYQSAFIYNSSCNIYFSLSPYTNYGDINENAQVTIVNQNTNESVLDYEKYPNEIKLTDVLIDESHADDKYYITINPDDIEGGEFSINQYYKVLIRFTDSAHAAAAPSTPALDSWLIDNSSYFSEWSTICLIRPISQPSVKIQGLIEETLTYMTNANVDFIGTLEFADSAETDSLKDYQIKLYDSDGKLLQDSGTQYANTYYGINEFNYTFNYSFVNSLSYTVTLDYETNNYYQESKEYKITIIELQVGVLDTDFTAFADIENGRIKVSLDFSKTGKRMGNITIRRTSSKSNFTIWEDVHTQFYSTQDNRKLVWYDYTIESGIWYKYGAQKRDYLGKRGTMKLIDKPVICYFDTMFLNAQNQQLAIKCNQKVTSFKYNLADSKVETLGSKYPFIIRNGYMNYREFALSGTITTFNDENQIFVSEAELYNNEADKYEHFNADNNIDLTNNYILEREFRNKVFDFIHQDCAMLLRTLTEGNIIVRLMDITFTPEDGLGRLIYNFTASAYEIADNTIANCDEYDIQTIGTYNPQAQTVEEYSSQESSTFVGDYIEYLNSKYEKLAMTGSTASVNNVKSIKVCFEDEPKDIQEVDGNLSYADASSKNVVAKGYILVVNGEDILIADSATYEITDTTGLKITSLVFPAATKATIYYTLEISYKEDLSQVTSTYTYSRVNGQIRATFDLNTLIEDLLSEKYKYNYGTYHEELSSINTISVQANAGTAIYVKEKDEDEYTQYSVDTTLKLLLISDSGIDSFYINGIHLEETDNANQDLSSLLLFYYDKKSYSAISGIINPQENYVYNINDTMFIRYHNGWYPFDTTNNVIKMPVNAIVDYTCDIVKGVYLE